MSSSPWCWESCLDGPLSLPVSPFSCRVGACAVRAGKTPATAASFSDRAPAGFISLARISRGHSSGNSESVTERRKRPTARLRIRLPGGMGSSVPFAKEHGGGSITAYSGRVVRLYAPSALELEGQVIARLSSDSSGWRWDEMGERSSLRRRHVSLQRANDALPAGPCPVPPPGRLGSGRISSRNAVISEAGRAVTLYMTSAAWRRTRDGAVWLRAKVHARRRRFRPAVAFPTAALLVQPRAPIRPFRAPPALHFGQAPPGIGTHLLS